MVKSKFVTVMKFLFVLISFFFSLVSVNAQKKYENSYLSITIPSGWVVKNKTISELNTEELYFYNSNNIGLILGTDYMQAPTYMLQSQMDSHIGILKDATFGAIHQTSFMGKPSQCVDFETMLDNARYKGTMYAFNEGGHSILTLGGYKIGVKSSLPPIWRSIKWKKKTKNGKQSKSLREELQGLANAITKRCQQTPVIIDDEQQYISFALEDDSDCVVYTYRLIDSLKSDYTEDELSEWQEEIRTDLIPTLIEGASQTELIRRCMEENYIFKYVYQDKNGEFLFLVKVVPDDYK